MDSIKNDDKNKDFQSVAQSAILGEPGADWKAYKEWCKESELSSCLLKNLVYYVEEVLGKKKEITMKSFEGERCAVVLSQKICSMCNTNSHLVCATGSEEKLKLLGELRDLTGEILYTVSQLESEIILVNTKSGNSL